MINFIEKHYKTIVVGALILLFGLNGLGLLRAAFPGVAEKGNDVLKEMFREVISEEVIPLTQAINDMEEKVDILFYNIADERVKQIFKNYDKLKKDASNLYWMDVEYIINKWPQMPEEYITAELLAIMEYIQQRYDDHILGS